MSAYQTRLFAVLGLAATLMAGLGAQGSGVQVATQEKSARGGLLAKADGHQFEVFFYRTGVRVFLTDTAGSPVDPSKLAATATFYHPNVADTPWFSRPLRATSSSLDLVIGLDQAPQTGAKVAFVVTGLGGSGGAPTSFTVPLEFVAQVTARPTAPPVATTPTPRYVYAPGYYGYGYYAYPGPQTLPQRTAGAPTYYGTPTYSSAPARSGSMSGHSVGAMHRDWSTGRDIPLAKPWMQPRD